jgi:hypothetical protein
MTRALWIGWGTGLGVWLMSVTVLVFPYPFAPPLIALWVAPVVMIGLALLALGRT